MGLKISKGTLENIIRRTSKKAENTYEQLRKVIEVSFFVGSDETGAKLKGKKMKLALLKLSFVICFIIIIFSAKAETDTLELKVYSFDMKEMIAPPVWRTTKMAIV